MKNSMIYKLLPLFLLLCTSFFISAQKPDYHFRKGNEFYKKNNFNEAEIAYRKGILSEPKSLPGNYNLANTLYKQNKFREANILLDSLSKKTNDKNLLSKVYHNMGNSHFKNKEYEKSIESFKRSLKLKPDDDETRYNLAYAMNMLRKQKENRDKKSNSNKSESKLNKENNSEPKKQNNRINKEEAERMLDALNRDEKDLRKKMKKRDGQDYSPADGKDW